MTSTPDPASLLAEDVTAVGVTDARPRVQARKVRVLHIIKTLGLGGAETNLLNLARAFDPARIETHVAYSFGGEIEPRFRAAGVRLFKYADASHRVKSLHSIAIVLRLAGYIRRHRIDIVQTHNFNAHIWGLLAARLGGAKVVEHVHDFRYVPSVELARRHGLLDQYRFIRYFKKWADRVVVLTKDNAAYVVEHGIADAGAVVEIPNGIPMGDVGATSRAASRAHFDVADDRLVILTSARMDPTKNIDLIVRIAGRVAAACPAAFFVVAGSGDDLDRLKRATDAAGLARHVRFIGFQQDTNALLAMADVFLLPSFLELHSIAILEALRAGLPVVVSRGVGCNDEFIVDGENGFLCDPFDERPWVDALGRLLGDAALRRRVGAQGRDTCDRLFDLPMTARRFESLYAELVP